MLTTRSEGFVEAAPRVELSANAVLEACFAARVSGALLQASNLPAKFFDLSSGEAGCCKSYITTGSVWRWSTIRRWSVGVSGSRKWPMRRAAAISSGFLNL